MIEKTQAYKTVGGKTFPTLGEAQGEELFQLLAPSTSAAPIGLSTDAANRALCDLLIDNAEKVVEILKQKERKKRKANGSPKPRRARLPLAIKSDAVEAAT